MATDATTRSLPRELIFRTILKFGLTETNWLLIKTMHRTGLLHRSRGSIPGVKLEWRTPAAVSETDIRLCERLLCAYSLARNRDGHESGTTGVWAFLVDTYFRELTRTLERGDPAALARLLAAMFRQDFMFGMSHGAWAAHVESPLGARIFALKWLDSMMALAEALGVIAIENPEQRFVGHLDVRDRDAILALLHDVERLIGVEMSLPDVGAAYGMSVEGRVIPPEMPEQLYTIMRLSDAIGLYLPGRDHASLRVVEIGAGYGGVCYWLLCHLPNLARYTIVDIPPVNVLHGYFLSKALGIDKVSLFGEPAAQVTVLPACALGDVEVPCDVVLNKDSMPEMPSDALELYLDWISRNCDGFFYSCNHETVPRLGEYSQRRVSAGAEYVDGLHRIRRDLSWLRRGYVEEIYTTDRSRRRQPPHARLRQIEPGKRA